MFTLHKERIQKQSEIFQWKGHTFAIQQQESQENNVVMAVVGSFNRHMERTNSNKTSLLLGFGFGVFTTTKSKKCLGEWVTQKKWGFAAPLWYKGMVCKMKNEVGEVGRYKKAKVGKKKKWQQNGKWRGERGWHALQYFWFWMLKKLRVIEPTMLTGICACMIPYWQSYYRHHYGKKNSRCKETDLYSVVCRCHMLMGAISCQFSRPPCWIMLCFFRTAVNALEAASVMIYGRWVLPRLWSSSQTPGG